MADTNQKKSGEDNSLRDYQIVLDLVKREYASVVWTHKTHEKQAELYTIKYSWLEMANVISAAVTACGIGSTLLTDSYWAKVMATFCSFVSLAITAYYKSFDIKGQSSISKAAANQFIIVRHELLKIIADLYRHERPLKSIEEEYRVVEQSLYELYRGAPSTSKKAVNWASNDLKNNSTYAMGDDEIDGLLPKSMRGSIA